LSILQDKKQVCKVLQNLLFVLQNEKKFTKRFSEIWQNEQKLFLLILQNKNNFAKTCFVLQN
jgi:hypothetical protein